MNSENPVKAMPHPHQVQQDKHKDCPCFTVFLRVLFKYLQKRGDFKSYHALKERVHVCQEKSRRREPGYESLARALLQEIPSIVKASDLHNVRAYLRLRVLQKNQRKRKDSSSDMTSKAVVRCNLFGILHQTPP